MSYPATFEVERPERMANWRPLVQYIMSIPTWIVLHSALNIVATITVIYAWLSVLVTGKQPPGLVAFHATYVRFRARTFSYVWSLTDKYPPFDFAPSASDPGGAGVVVNISPRLEGMNRLNVLFRCIGPFAWLSIMRILELIFGFEIFAPWVWFIGLVLGAVLIPAAVYSVIVWIIANVAAIFGLLAVTFTGRWPESMYRVCAGWVRVDARLWAYAMLLTDDYPPFSLD